MKYILMMLMTFPVSLSISSRKDIDDRANSLMIVIMLNANHFWISVTLLVWTPLALADEEESPLSSLPAESKKSSTHDLIRHLLDQDLGLRKFPFPDVVLASSGKKVIPVEQSNTAHQQIIGAISKATNDAITTLNAPDSPVRKLRRINEASRFFEDQIRQIITKQPSLTCSIPKNTQGKEQRSGYPDLLITHTAADGTITRAYLDPKLFEERSQASSFRTFYFEPRTRTNKIQHDAIHLLIGISHDGKDGAWTFTSWKICDLSQFQVRLKAEFQASNRDLYRPNIIIKSSTKDR